MLRIYVYILIWLPASVSYSIVGCVAFRSSFRFSWHLRRSLKASFIKHFTLVLCIFFFAAKSSAQTADTAFVDTISMKNIDRASGFDEDAYADTTEKHIYDTSEYFFTWKKFGDELYASEKMQQRSLPDSAIQQLKNSKDFWYVPAIEKLETRIKNDPAFRDSLLKAANKEFNDNEKDFTQQAWFGRLLWCIIIGIFLAGLIYFLVQNKISLFSKESRAAASESFDAGENGDIFRIPYTELLRKAEKEENYRSAVRLLYLQTLKLLSEAGLIQYQPDHTNLQYVQQLHNSTLYDNFSTVTRHYEFVWYGQFEITKGLYDKVKNDFFRLQNKVA